MAPEPIKALFAPQASQCIPEEYEAGAQAGMGGQDLTQQAKGDVLEEPAGVAFYSLSVLTSSSPSCAL